MFKHTKKWAVSNASWLHRYSARLGSGILLAANFIAPTLNRWTILGSNIVTSGEVKLWPPIPRYPKISQDPSMSRKVDVGVISKHSPQDPDQFIGRRELGICSLGRKSRILRPRTPFEEMDHVYPLGLQYGANWHQKMHSGIQHFWTARRSKNPNHPRPRWVVGSTCYTQHGWFNSNLIVLNANRCQSLCHFFVAPGTEDFLTEVKCRDA